MDATYFPYGETEITYLKNKDKRLAAVIEQVGHIDRTGDTDLFSSVVHHILGQQISTKAQQTIWTKLMTELGAVTPNTLLACGRERLQAFGTTWKKVDYILDFAGMVRSGEFDIDALNTMTDAEAINAPVSYTHLCKWNCNGYWRSSQSFKYCCTGMWYPCRYGDTHSNEKY